MRRRGTDPVAVIIVGAAVWAAAGHPTSLPAHKPGGANPAAHAEHLAHQRRTGGGGGAGKAPAVTSPTAGASAAIAYALSKQGDPYSYGAAGPDAFDCSGLMMAAWASAGVSIPRTSEGDWAQLPHVSNPQPGDMILYTGGDTALDPPPGHVTMYLGNGRMVEAYGSGVPVRVTAVRPGVWGYVRPGGGG